MYSWNDKRTKLIELIKNISNRYGSDEKEFLDDYIFEVVDKYKMEMDMALICFEDIWKNCST